MKQTLKDFVKAVLLVGWVCSCQYATADDASGESKDPSPQALKDVLKPTRGTPKKPGTITTEREAVLLDFAKQNHPELATLLQNLKSKAPQDYQAALIDLNRTVDRLMKSREKSAEKYEAQLEEWKNLSRVRLLEARFVMTDDQAVEKNLRVALGEQLKLKVTAQELERDRLRKRLEKLNQSIDEMKSDPEAVVDKQLVDLRKKLPATKPATRARSKKSTDSTPAREKEMK